MKILITSLFTLCLLPVFSQEGPKVVVFNAAPEKEPFQYKNLIKLSPLEAFSGDLTMYYERVLTKNLSGEVGLGITIDDYLSTLLDNLDYEYDYDQRNALIGTSFGLGIRYYPYEASEEFYFAPEFKYRYYHNTYTPNSQNTSLSFEESSKLANFRLTVGYVHFFEKNIFIEGFAGLGIGMVSTTYYSSVYNNDTNTDDYIRNSIRKPKPKLALGVKFGFAF